MPLSLYTYYTERELLSCDNLFPIRLLYNMQINMFKLNFNAAYVTVQNNDAVPQN